MKELEAIFRKEMLENNFHIRYNGEFTTQTYDKYFQIWLIGYKSGLKSKSS